MSAEAPDWDNRVTATKAAIKALSELPSSAYVTGELARLHALLADLQAAQQKARPPENQLQAIISKIG